MVEGIVVLIYTFAQQSGTICEILVEGIMRNNSENILIWTSGSGGDVYRFLIYSSDSHFVRRSGTICAILVGGILRDISVKLFKLMDQWLWFRRGYRLKILLSRALAVLLFSGAEPFVQFMFGGAEGFVGTFKWNYFELGAVVQEMSFKEKVNGRWPTLTARQTKTDHNS